MTSKHEFELGTPVKVRSRFYDAYSWVGIVTLSDTAGVVKVRPYNRRRKTLGPGKIAVEINKIKPMLPEEVPEDMVACMMRELLEGGA